MDLFHRSFEDIIVTPSIVNEIEKVGGARFVKRIEEVLHFEKMEEGTFIFVVPLNSKELQYAHKLKTEYGLSIADSECVAVVKVRKKVLLSDDKYLGKMAIKEGLEYIYDLLPFWKHAL